MASVFSKLNLGSRTDVTVLNAPASFGAVLATLDGVTVRTSLRGETPIEFALAFVTTQAQVNDLSARLSARMPGDALLWFAYPKQSSKRYRCEFNRDTGWAAVGAAGFEPVRQIAIDEDWSALRFRRVEYIKKLTRSETRVLSPAGRARTRE
jgi:hypothetical protein